MATGSTASIREMLEGGNEQQEPPVKDGETKEKEQVESEKKVSETEEDTERTESERTDETDEDDVDETEEEEGEDKPTSRAKDERSAFAKLKKEQGAKELLKKFPEVEDAFYEHREYRKVFGSIDEAKTAAAKADFLTKITPELFSGNIEPLLDEINNKDPEAVVAIARNFLPMLAKNSPKLFNAIINPVINNLFAKLANEAEQTGNEDLDAAVKYLAQKVLGKEKPEKLDVRPVKREGNEKEEAAINARAQGFYEHVAESVEAKLDAEINRGLDPDNVLTKELRDTAVEKIRIKVLKMLKSDEEHMSIMRSLNKAAMADNFSKEQRARVVRQIVNAARNLIPEVRSSTKKAMFGNMFTKNSEERGRIEAGQDKGSGSGPAIPFDPNKVDWNQTSLRDALDFDEKKVVLRK